MISIIIITMIIAINTSDTYRSSPRVRQNLAHSVTAAGNNFAHIITTLVARRAPLMYYFACTPRQALATQNEESLASRRCTTRHAVLP